MFLFSGTQGVGLSENYLFCYFIFKIIIVVVNFVIDIIIIIFDSFYMIFFVFLKNIIL